MTKVNLWSSSKRDLIQMAQRACADLCYNSLISPQNISLPLEDDEESLLSESSSSSESSVEDIDAIENDKLEKLARSYRHHLTHTFDDRFREPLWQPTACEIADIGYLTSSGAFHTLFNVSITQLRRKALADNNK